jgi:dipeptidyl aminopeptidase/acylaminoacyl peptidase
MNQGRDVYLYDNKTQLMSKPFKTLLSSKKIAEQFIQQKFIAQKVQVEYQVSDGMWQFGYVTLPLGKKAKEVPLIVVPHGGPWSRVKGNYSSIIQLLANRGYAVFEPNFRSSTGMGRNYVLSANKDFGDGIVQQDIIDGMRYVLYRGVGNPNELAMFGHSFGGFSTLAALAFTPELFQVGIAGAPPSDLSKSIKQLSNNKQNDKDKIRQNRLMKLGVDLNDLQDLQRLSAQSPDANWQKVNKPLYMLAGGRDDRVAVTGVRDYAIRLEQAGKPISLLIDEDEGHSFNKDIAREAYAYVLEHALATHLDGIYQKEVSNNLKLYLKRKMVIDRNGVLDSVH